MATAEDGIALRKISSRQSAPKPASQVDGERSISLPPRDSEVLPDDVYSTDAIPDGGYGWVIVLAGAILTFWINGVINCWGVLQAALLRSTLADKPTSTVTFIGSLTLGTASLISLPAMRSIRSIGPRYTAMAGITLMGLGMIFAGSSIDNLAGLFVTVGLMIGTGNSMAYTVGNILPVQYFSGKIGLANGLIKMGGGVGGTVMAVALEALLHRVGISWTFRTQGFLTLATGLPAAWLMKERVSIRNVPFADLSMFRNLQFTAIFLSGSIGVFALFVPPYFLPLFAESIGLSTSTGAALVSAFNACNAIGRFAGGPLCDRLGPINTYLLVMTINAVTMLAIWPVSNTVGPLAAFACLNGVANGAFFTVFPMVMGTIFGPGRAAVAMSMSLTGFVFGYLFGTPIAGVFLQRSLHAGVKGPAAVEQYRPAIFYAGGIAAVSALLSLVARLASVRNAPQRS